ncbi:unnamed protein product [Absidia cylindrospora]
MNAWRAFLAKKEKKQKLQLMKCISWVAVTNISSLWPVALLFYYLQKPAGHQNLQTVHSPHDGI